VLDPFFDLFATVLSWFYSLVPNYGVAIILLTIAVMLVVTPLTLKGTRSMMELQFHQPELRRIQTQYRDDRQKMNEEMMKFYAEHKINPLGGCLPLLVQLPLFIILYNVIRGLTNRTSLLDATLAGDPSLGGTFDPKYLDESSDLYVSLHQSREMVAFGIDLARTPMQAMSDGLGTAWPYLLLVVGIFATSFIQQKQIQGRSTQAVNPQMQMITRIMPPMFAIFSLNFPAGLALYWCTSGLWRIGQQHLIGKRIYTDENKARLEAAKARNDELVAGTEPGFMDKVFGGAQPNVRQKPKAGGKGEVVDTKEAPAKAGGTAKPGGSPKAGTSGRVTPPGSRSAASRKRKRKK
jgi:YidC/Oxa1 family membrane protein insertase